MDIYIEIGGTWDVGDEVVEVLRLHQRNLRLTDWP
jgi:hypothetical protein